MNLIQYVPLAVRTEKPLPTPERMIHSCLGLITEIGEVVTELKRIHIYGKPLDAERKKNILEEAGDVMWYVAIMLDILNANLFYVWNAPKFIPQQDDTEVLAKTALMLGEHCGRICTEVQELCDTQQEKDNTAQLLLASLTMIINGMRVLAEICGSTLELEMDNNIAKLRIRFPDAYSNEAAEARADKAGVDARNS